MKEINSSFKIQGIFWENRDLSTLERASQAGITQPHLSQTEAVKRDGGTEIMKRRAQALGVTKNVVV